MADIDEEMRRARLTMYEEYAYRDHCGMTIPATLSKKCGNFRFLIRTRAERPALFLNAITVEDLLANAEEKLAALRKRKLLQLKPAKAKK